MKVIFLDSKKYLLLSNSFNKFLISGNLFIKLSKLEKGSFFSKEIELGIEIIHPQQISNLVEIHRDETLDIIYQRIALEIMKPYYASQIFVIDGKLYYLLNMTRYNALPQGKFFTEK